MRAVGVRCVCSLFGELHPQLARCAGSQTITGSYPGDATHQASSGQTDLTIVVAPAAPTITGLANGDGQVAVSFTDADPGTSPITSYEVTATDLSDSTAPAVTAKGPSSPVTVTGLTNGDTYVFTVTATSADGTSPPSAPSGRLNVGRGAGDPERAGRWCRRSGLLLALCDHRGAACDRHPDFRGASARPDPQQRRDARRHTDHGRHL